MLLLSLVSAGYAQSPTIEWKKTYGGTSNEIATCVIQTNDGGYAMVGYAASNDGDVSGIHGAQDIWVVKVNSTGTIEWQKMIGGSAYEQAQAIIQTTDNGYAIAGKTNSANNGDVTGQHQAGYYDCWVVKLNSTGTILWQKTLGGTSDEESRDIIQTKDGGFCLTGIAKSNNGDVTVKYGGNDMWIVKLTSAGVIEWQKSIGAIADEAGYSVVQTADSGYVVVGLTSSIADSLMVSLGHHGGTDALMVKLNSAGIIQWYKLLGGSGEDGLRTVILTSDGGYVMSGQTNSNDGDVSGNHGDYDFWVVKLDSNRNIQWQKTLGGNGFDIAYGIVQTTDGGYIVSGSSDSISGNVTLNNGEVDFWAVKLSSIGIIQWQTSLGGSLSEGSTSIIQSNDGDFVLAGFTYSMDGDVVGNHGLQDYWLVKLNAPCVAGFNIYPDINTQHNWFVLNQATGNGSLTYIWYWGDGTNSTSTTPSHTYSAAGNYNICLTITDSAGCTDTYCDSSTYIYKAESMVTVNVVSQLPTGINEAEANAIISIYPNPATNQLFIQTNGTAVSEVNIYNTTGSLVSQTKQPQTKSIDISQLANGVYIAEIKTKEASVMRRWVKM